MKQITLKDGHTIPALGFGTWQLKDEECVAAVRTALEVGYRHIDTADVYGNHEAVAEGIKQSGIPREEFYLTTKIFPGNLEHSQVLEKVDTYLKELNTDYLDLLLIHWPDHSVLLSETLEAMEEARTAGKIRSLGVSNFTEHHLADAKETGIDIVLNQVEMHPGFPQQKMRSYCRDNGLALTAYSPLGRGKTLEMELLQTLAQKYEKTPAQIALNWLLAVGVAAIPKSAKADRIKENFTAQDFEMEKEDVSAVDALNDGERLINPEFANFDY